MGKIFISYSHKDKKWKDRLVTQLSVLEKEKKLEVWDDKRIAAGADWLPEIKEAMQTCDVALLLISADFLTSGFILDQEVPKILERRIKEGIRVIPVILLSCQWKAVAWLSGIQARPADGKPLSSLTKAKAEDALSDLAGELLQLTAATGRSEPESNPNQPDQIDANPKWEKVICLKAEADFQIAMRQWNESPISKDQIAKLEEIIKGDYGPFQSLMASVDIRIEHYLLPLINMLIQIESDLRARYRLPFSQNRIEEVKEKIRRLVKDNWPYIVNSSYEDAIKHVIYNQGGLFAYKEKELGEMRDKLLNQEPNQLFNIIDELLQKALADSILL